MILLGKGRLCYILALLVGLTYFQQAKSHPVDGSRLDGVSGDSPSSVTSSDLDIPSYDYAHVVGEDDYYVYPDLFEPNATSGVDSRGGNRFPEVDSRVGNRFPGVDSRVGNRFPEVDSRVENRFPETDSRGGNDFLEMDPNVLGDVLEFLDVESLDQHDPAFEKAGGLQVMTQGGDHLEVTRGQDGSISVNGSVVDGVMSLPDGTEIYTLERFLEEHRHLMDEALKHLTAQSKSLQQTNGRNFVTKPQPKDHEVEMKFEINDQISRSTSPDVEVPMPFSVSVSEVTEISTKTSPPEMSVQEGTPRVTTVTEVSREPLSPDENLNSETNQTGFTASQSPHEDIYHDDQNLDYPAYDDVTYYDEIIYDDAHFGGSVSRPETQGEETSEQLITNKTRSTSTAVSERHKVSEITPTEEVGFNETLREIIPLTELPLDLESHHSEPLVDLPRKAKEINSDTDLNRINVNRDTVEKVSGLEDVTEQVPIQTTMPFLESDVNDDSQIPVTEPIRISVSVPEPMLKDEELVTLIEKEENSTVISEMNTTDAESLVLEQLSDVEDSLPVTELGPFQSEIISEPETESHSIDASVLAEHELATESGLHIPDNSHVETETSVDFTIQSEHSGLLSSSPDAATEKKLLPEILPLQDEDTLKLTLPRHVDTLEHNLNIADVATKDQESSTVIVPAIPPVISEIDILPIIDVWGFALLEQENDTTIVVKDDRVPKTILTPEFHEFVNVVPQDTWHPLYASNPESKALRKEFIVDYLIEESLSPEDERMASPEGFNVSNVGGKELSFRRDDEGYLSINGVPVLDFSTLSDGTVTYTLATFLFDHRALVKEALLKHNRARVPDLSADALGPPLEIPDVQEILPAEQTVQEVTETISSGALPPSEVLPVTEAIGSIAVNIPEIKKSIKEESALQDPTDISVSETEGNQASNHGHAKAEDRHLIPRTLPLVPETVILGRHFSLLQFWALSLEDQERLSVPANKVGPKTLLNPDIFVVESLVPEGIENPLLSNKTENRALRTEFVLDYLLPQSVDLQDLKTAPEGRLRVTNLNGKDLVFEGNFGSGSKGQGYLTVNGVDITKIVTLADGTHVFELEDLLFDHRQRISELAYQGQGESSHDKLPGTLVASEGLKEPSLSVPAIPLPAAINPIASQTHLWSYNQFYQDKYHNLDDARFPKTILSPSYKKMENLIPNDDRYPLYENTNQHHVDMRAEFLLSYLLLESVDETDTRITQPGGLTVQNLLGENITFSMDDKGNLDINGVLVEKVDTLDSDMKVYHLQDFLFDHSDIQTINDEYGKSTNSFNSLNPQPVELSESQLVVLDDLPIKKSLNEPDVDTVGNQTLNYVPNIPELIEDSELSLINLWRFSLRHQDLSFLIAERKIPMTVLSPINDKMQNMVPENSPHPLYDDSPESVALRTEFLLDYLALDRISPNDTRITEPEGLTVLNLNQKELIFSNDLDGNLMVSGIPVEDVQTLPDGTHIYTLSDFLFDHKILVSEALRKLRVRSKEALQSGVTDQVNFEGVEGQL